MMFFVDFITAGYWLCDYCYHRYYDGSTIISQDTDPEGRRTCSECKV